MQSLDDDTISAWQKLAMAPGLSCLKVQQLTQVLGNPLAILTQSAHQLQSLGLKSNTIDYLRHENPPVTAVRHWLNAAPQRYLLTLNDPLYPQALLEIPDPPVMLFFQGQPHSLAAPRLAIVGSRRASKGGQEIAHQFAAQLAARGMCIVSGLAFGIDAAAHLGALSVEGISIAIMGRGLADIYPATHRRLANDLLSHGAWISEYLPSVGPRPHHFPCRNRIISGLALGVLVVQAAERSGSLITAEQALGYNREVFAVPGHIHDANSVGCHQLIQSGAKLVTKIDDILAELPAGSRLKADDATHLSREGEKVLATETQKLVECVGYEPTSIDTIATRCGLTASAVSAMLIELEIQGLVCSDIGGYRRLGN